MKNISISQHLHGECLGKSNSLDTLRQRQNGRHFTDDIFKCIFLNENVWILINISLKFVGKGLIDHISSLVQIMAWRHPGDKPLSEPMMISLPTHICVTRPQWVKFVCKDSSHITAGAKLNYVDSTPILWHKLYLKWDTNVPYRAITGNAKLHNSIYIHSAAHGPN